MLKLCTAPKLLRKRNGKKVDETVEEQSMSRKTLGRHDG